MTFRVKNRASKNHEGFFMGFVFLVIMSMLAVVFATALDKGKFNDCVRTQQTEQRIAKAMGEEAPKSQDCR